MTVVMSTLMQLSAFAETPGGGNPAGVWVGTELPEVAKMQALAAELGHSETAFICPEQGPSRTIRYYSPESEVPFCGHATIATGVALGRLSGAGTYRLDARPGPIDVEVAKVDGQWRAAFVSVPPRHESAPEAVLSAALAALAWQASDLDPAIPPSIAYAGARHLVLAVAREQRLSELSYHYEDLKRLLIDNDIVTAQLVFRAPDGVVHSRNPFPTGGVVEDPATGAAAAALGGYLRDAGLLEAPASFVVRQGEAMGRPSVLHVDVPAEGGIRISGTAVDL